MKFLVESGVPFLSVPLVEFLFTLPERYIIDEPGVPKSILRNAMRGIVPDRILDRRDKLGFVTPEKRWLDKLSSWVDTTLGDADTDQLVALDGARICHEWGLIRSGARRFDPCAWRWINLIAGHADFQFLLLPRTQSE